MDRTLSKIVRHAGWLLLGLLIGSGLGLLMGWVIWPAEFTEANPSILEDQYKRDYALMTASTYWEDNNLIAAEKRLESLGEADPFRWYRDLTLDYILGEENETDIRHLVNLAADLGIYSQVMEPYWPGAAEK